MSKKFGELKIMRTFATRLRKNGNKTSSLKRLETVQASTEKKYNLSRSVNFFGNYEVSETSLEIYRILYNEEFDPGSG